MTTDTADRAAVFSDGLGDRVRASGPGGRALEVLRLRPEFMNVASFEFALRERASRLAAFRDPAFAEVVGVESVQPGRAVEVHSLHVEGRRLSELLAEVEAGREELTLAGATALLRQLVAAVVGLHARVQDAAHGAIAPERIVIDGERRLVLVEHVLGAAVEQLQWPRRRLWRELRIAMPPSAGVPRFDARADLAQVGAVALALLAGRRLRDEDYPDGLPAVLREVSERVARREPTLAVGVTGWLVRALQIETRSFGSMKEAASALGDLLRPEPAGAAQGKRARPLRVSGSVSPAPSPAGARAQLGHGQAAVSRRQSTISIQHSAISNRRSSPRWWSIFRTALVLVALAATTAAATVRYLKTTPAAAESSAGADRNAAQAARGPVRSGAAHRRAASAGAVLVDAELLDVVPLDESGRGWIEVTAPVDMEIAEQGRALGVARSGRLEMAAGWHELEIANPTLGFRETRRIHVAPGGTTTLDIHLPLGSVDLNAAPWAEVWLDGERVGETPISGLALPVGPHEFVFRHPDLGERRQAVSVRVGEPVRVSVDLTGQ